MKCANCQRDFPLTELLFKSTGLHPKLAMPTHAAKCKTCMAKIPIDQTSREPSSDDEIIADGGFPF